MTTIVYREGLLVADSAVLTDNVIAGACEKIRFVPSVGHFALAGSLEALEEIDRWVRAGRNLDDRPIGLDDFNGLMVGLDGQVTGFGKNLLPIKIAGPFHAEGSGRELAYGAMAHGASAVEAALIACRFDAYSREPLQIVRVPVPQGSP